MSGLYDDVLGLYTKGMKAAPPAVWTDPRLKGDEIFTPAAVLIAITDRPDPGILLLHRPSHMRAHPGQIAFPGGRCDEGEDAVDAALREAEEELGIDATRVRVIGPSDRYYSGSGYEITPVLAVVPGDIAITPNPAEVAQWFEAPVDFLLTPANQTEQQLEYDGAFHRFIEILWQDHRIWGVTAAILYNLSQRLRWHG